VNVATRPARKASLGADFGRKTDGKAGRRVVATPL
jgi:hypothetical protein